MLQGQLERVRKELGALEEKFNEAIGNKALLENRENILKKQSNDCALALAQIGVVDTDAFESQHTDLLNVALVGLDKMRDTLQSDINSALRKQRETKGRKNSDLKNLIYRFKNPVEEITMKYHDWRSDVSRLPEAVEFMGEYQAYYQRLLDEDLPGFESRFNKYLQENIINKGQCIQCILPKLVSVYHQDHRPIELVSCGHRFQGCSKDVYPVGRSQTIERGFEGVPRPSE